MMLVRFYSAEEFLKELAHHVKQHMILRKQYVRITKEIDPNFREIQAQAILSFDAGVELLKMRDTIYRGAYLRYSTEEMKKRFEEAKQAWKKYDEELVNTVIPNWVKEMEEANEWLESAMILDVRGGEYFAEGEKQIV